VSFTKASQDLQRLDIRLAHLIAIGDQNGVALAQPG